MNDLQKYPLDLTGGAPDNRVENEIHLITREKRVIALKYGAFYTKNLVIHFGGVIVERNKYRFSNMVDDIVKKTGCDCAAIVEILDPSVDGEIQISYNCVGGEYVDNAHEMVEFIRTHNFDVTGIHYSRIIDPPDVLKYKRHFHDIRDTTGWSQHIAIATRIANILDRISIGQNHPIRVELHAVRERLKGIEWMNENDFRQMIDSVNTIKDSIGDVDFVRTAQLDEVKLNFANTVSGVDNKLNLLRQDFTDVSTSFERFKTTVNGLSTSKDNHENRITTLEGKTINITSDNQVIGVNTTDNLSFTLTYTEPERVRNAINHLDQVTKTVLGLNLYKDEAERKFTALNTEVSGHTTKLAEHKQSIDAHAAKLSNHDTQFEAVTSKFSSVDATVGQLSTSIVEGINSVNERLNTDLTAMDSKIDNAKNSLGTRISNLSDDVTAKFNTQNEQNTSILSRITDVEAANSQNALNFNNKLKEIKTSIEQSNEQGNAALASRMDTLVSENESIKQSIEAAKQAQAATDETIRNSISDVDTKVSELNIWKGSASTRLNTLDTTVTQTLPASINSVETRVTELEKLPARVSALENNEATFVKKADYDARVTSVDDKFTTQDGKNTELLNKINEIKTSVESASNNAIPAIQDDLNTAKQEINDRIDTATNALSDATNRVTELETNRETVNAKLGTVENSIAQHTAQLTSISGNVDGLTTRITTNEAGINTINGQITTINDKFNEYYTVAAHTAFANEVETTKTSHDARITTLETNAGKLKKTIDENHQTIADISSKLGALGAVTFTANAEYNSTPAADDNLIEFTITDNKDYKITYHKSQSLVDVEAQAERNKNAISTIDNKLTSQITKVNEQGTKLTELGDSITDLTGKVTTNTQTLGSLTTSVDAVKNNIATIQSQLTSDANTVNGLSNRLTTAEGKLSAVETTVNNTITPKLTELTSSVSTINGNIIAANTNIDNLKTKTTELTTNLDTVRTTASEGKSLAERNQTEIGKINSNHTKSVSEINGKIDAINSTLGTSGPKLTTIENKVASLESRDGELTTLVEQAKSAADNAQTTANRNATEIGKINNNHTQLSNQVTTGLRAVNDTLSTHGNKITAVEGSITNLGSRIDSVNSTLDGKITTAKDTADSAKTKADALETTLTQLSNKVSGIETNQGNVSEQINSAVTDAISQADTGYQTKFNEHAKRIDKLIDNTPIDGYLRLASLSKIKYHYNVHNSDESFDFMLFDKDASASNPAHCLVTFDNTNNDNDLSTTDNSRTRPAYESSTCRVFSVQNPLSDIIDTVVVSGPTLIGIDLTALKRGRYRRDLLWLLKLNNDTFKANNGYRLINNTEFINLLKYIEANADGNGILLLARGAMNQLSVAILNYHQISIGIKITDNKYIDFLGNVFPTESLSYADYNSRALEYSYFTANADVNYIENPMVKYDETKHVLEGWKLTDKQFNDHPQVILDSVFNSQTRDGCDGFIPFQSLNDKVLRLPVTGKIHNELKRYGGVQFSFSSNLYCPESVVSISVTFRSNVNGSSVKIKPVINDLPNGQTGTMIKRFTRCGYQTGMGDVSSNFGLYKSGDVYDIQDPREFVDTSYDRTSNSEQISFYLDIEITNASNIPLEFGIGKFCLTGIRPSLAYIPPLSEREQSSLTESMINEIKSVVRTYVSEKTTPTNDAAVTPDWDLTNFKVQPGTEDWSSVSRDNNGNLVAKGVVLKVFNENGATTTASVYAPTQQIEVTSTQSWRVPNSLVGRKALITIRASSYRDGSLVVHSATRQAYISLPNETIQITIGNICSFGQYLTVNNRQDYNDAIAPRMASTPISGQTLPTGIVTINV